MAESAGRSHTIRAQRELKRRILSGELKGGQRLTEVPIAEEFSISRTPVREAMSRLAEEGLLERAPTTGFIVRSFDLKDIYDVIELRGVLEGTAVRLAAERGADPQQLERMIAIVANLDNCFNDTEIDFDRFIELNTEYHKVLSRLPGSKMLESEIERLRAFPFGAPFPVLSKQSERTRRDKFELAQYQHREILKAVSNREGSRAEALAREHVRLARFDVKIATTRDDPLLGGLVMRGVNQLS